MAVQLQDVTFAYGENVILRGVNATFPDRGVIELRAPSGKGKTTLLRLLAGLARPTEGAVLGTPKAPAFLFQEHRLLPWETALQNVQLAARDTDAAMRWLEAVGLADAAQMTPREMSGGMQRRLTLARALALPSDALFLDEPFVGIDRERVEELLAPIAAYAEEHAVFLVTHAEEEAAMLGAQTWILQGSPVTAVEKMA